MSLRRHVLTLLSQKEGLMWGLDDCRRLLCCTVARRLAQEWTLR